MPTYNYLNKDVTARFDDPNAVSPEDATLFLYDAIINAGGNITAGFEPEQTLYKSDPGYVNADFQIELPDGRRLWVSVECPATEA